MQIFRNVPASKFAHPPDRSYRCEYPPQGSRGFYIRAHRALLPPHAPDMLTVRIQAIDGTGTFTLPDFQPCRLLTLLHRHYPASSLLLPRPTPAVAAALRDVEAATLAHNRSPPITTNHLSDVPCLLPRRIERVRVSIASPLMQPSPDGSS